MNNQEAMQNQPATKRVRVSQSGVTPMCREMVVEVPASVDVGALGEQVIDRLFFAAGWRYWDQEGGVSGEFIQDIETTCEVDEDDCNLPLDDFMRIAQESASKEKNRLESGCIPPPNSWF